MFTFTDLALPIVGAPMAGGPSTPQLAAAVSNAGGLGMLAAGYLTPKELASQVARTRELTDRPFGVNLFSPTAPDENPPGAGELMAAYRQALSALGAEYGVDTVGMELEIPDHYAAHLTWLVENPVPVVTFTFGCPTASEIACLQAAGSSVGVTVTSADDARVSAQRGANFLCVQGPQAGGHQSTFRVQDEVNQLPLAQLVPAVQAVTDLPLVAGGGVCGAEDARQIIEAGAVAVQVGTLLLLADEAGSNEVYRAALQNSRGVETMPTRAFTGRPARALVNEFVRTFDAVAPSVYPAPHYLTAPLRAAAKEAGRAEHLNLWAGTGFENAQPQSATSILRQLAQGLPLESPVADQGRKVG